MERGWGRRGGALFGCGEGGWIVVEVELKWGLGDGAFGITRQRQLDILTQLNTLFITKPPRNRYGSIDCFVMVDKYSYSHEYWKGLIVSQAHKCNHCQAGHLDFETDVDPSPALQMRPHSNGQWLVLVEIMCLQVT